MNMRAIVAVVFRQFEIRKRRRGVSNTDDSLPPSGQTVRRAFDLLVATLNDRQIRYAIIGGMAVIQHARVRTTDDIDALLVLPQLQMAGLFEALADQGFTIELHR